MEVFVAQLINGLSVGSMYALLVTGFTLLLLVAGVIQYAFAHIVVFSMYMAWLTLQVTDNNVMLAITAAIISAILLSILTEPLFRPLTKRGAINQSFVLAIAIGLVLTHTMSHWLNQGVPISFPPSLAMNVAIIKFGVATISTGQLFTFFGSFIVVAAFFYLLYRTRQGRAFRAMAQNPFVARLLGIPITRTGISSYAIAGLLGGITAVFLAMSLGSAYAALSDAVAIKVIAIALFAGLGNLQGGLICALILGVAESMTLGYLPGRWSNAIAFAMILAIVILRPRGLFGTRT